MHHYYVFVDEPKLFAYSLQAYNNIIWNINSFSTPTWNVHRFLVETSFYDYILYNMLILLLIQIEFAQTLLFVEKHLV